MSEHESLFGALSEYVMVHGGSNRHDLLIGISRLRESLKDADDKLREYAAERSHGATCNSDWLDRCVAAARFHTTQALSLNTDGEFES